MFLVSVNGVGLPVCDEQVDLVFGLVFAQTLITKAAFDDLKLFLKEAVNYFNVQPNKVRIGIFQHDMFPEFVINLRTGSTRDVLVQEIDKLEYFRYGVNGADIPLSIQYARTHAYTLAAGGRPGVRKILILMTTRDPNDAEATRFEVETGNRELGLDIISVGIGGQVSATGLASAASKPNGVVLVGTTKPAELRQPIMNAYRDYTCRQTLPGVPINALTGQPELTIHTCQILQGRVHMKYVDGYIRDPMEFKRPSESSNYTGQIAASAGYCTRDTCDPVGCRSGWQPIGGRSLRSWACLPEHAAFGATNFQSWCPYFCAESTYKPYIQLDMGGYYDVAGLTYQGRRKYEHWVTKFTLMYSMDGNAWEFVKEDGRIKVRFIKKIQYSKFIQLFNLFLQEFQGNTNARDVVLLTLGSLMFKARYIRLIVTDFHGVPAMHVDVFRCPGGKFKQTLTVFFLTKTIY